MKELKISLYSFEELSEEAQERAREEVKDSSDFRYFLEDVETIDYEDVDLDALCSAFRAKDGAEVWRAIRDYLDELTVSKSYWLSFPGGRKRTSKVQKLCEGRTWLEQDVIDGLRYAWREIASGQVWDGADVISECERRVKNSVEQDVNSECQVEHYCEICGAYFNEEGALIPHKVSSLYTGQY
jgi:hypothetical protein